MKDLVKKVIAPIRDTMLNVPNPIRGKMIKAILPALIGLCLITTQALADDQLECLAKNIYHEARGEELLGQLAVGLVTLQRVESSKYPDSICEVVYQPGAFSWTKEDKLIKNKDILDDMRKVANIVKDLYPDYDWSADHYHNLTVNPSWASKLQFVCQIGNHKFYKEK